MSKSIHVYVLGGAGIETSKEVVIVNAESNGSVKMLAIDSNPYQAAAAGIPESSTFIFDGLSGSGGLRVSNASTFKSMMAAPMGILPPSDWLNICVASFGAATGSVLVNQISKFILEMDGKPLVIIAIAPDNVEDRLQNALQCFSAFEHSIIEAVEKDVCIAYIDAEEESDTIPSDSTSESLSGYALISYRVSKLLMYLIEMGTCFPSVDNADLATYFCPSKDGRVEPELLKVRIQPFDFKLGENELQRSTLAMVRSGEMAELPLDFVNTKTAPSSDPEAITGVMMLTSAYSFTEQLNQYNYTIQTLKVKKPKKAKTSYGQTLDIDI